VAAIHPFAHDTVAPAWSAAGRRFRRVRARAGA